jgi:hypothetical protein
MKITKKRFNEITKLALQEAIIRIVQEEAVTATDDEGEGEAATPAPGTPAVNPAATPGSAEQPAFSPDDQAAMAARQAQEAGTLHARIMDLVHSGPIQKNVSPWFEEGLAGMIAAMLGSAETYEGRTTSLGSQTSAGTTTGTAE